MIAGWPLQEPWIAPIPNEVNENQKEMFEKSSIALFQPKGSLGEVE